MDDDQGQNECTNDLDKNETILQDIFVSKMSDVKTEPAPVGNKTGNAYSSFSCQSIKPYGKLEIDVKKKLH